MYIYVGQIWCKLSIHKISVNFQLSHCSIIQFWLKSKHCIVSTTCNFMCLAYIIFEHVQVWTIYYYNFFQQFRSRDENAVWFSRTFIKVWSNYLTHLDSLILHFLYNYVSYTYNSFCIAYVRNNSTFITGQTITNSQDRHLWLGIFGSRSEIRYLRSGSGLPVMYDVSLASSVPT